jgi:hypothetical protein
MIHYIYVVARDAARKDDRPMTYAIHHSNGRTETGIVSYAEAVAVVALQYDGCEIGHDGDLSSGGDRTLVWASEADSVDDDGARAVASIWRES